MFPEAEATLGEGQLEPPVDSAPENLRSVVNAAPVPDPLPDSSEEPTQPTIQDAFEIFDQALDVRDPWSGDFSQFATKYAAATPNQLRLARIAVEDKLERDRTRITKELFDTGRYQEALVKPEDPSPLPQATGDRPSVSFGLSMEQVNGGTLIKYAVIEPEEYPDYHSLSMEYTWLASTVAKLDRQSKEQ